MRNLFGLLVSGVFVIVVFVSANLFETVGKEASRKYSHILLSNWWVIALVFFDNVYVASIGPVLFIIINSLSYKFNLIKTIERDESEKDGLGTVYYAISLFLMVVITYGIFKEYNGIYGPTIGLAGCAVMGYGDGLAGIIGRSIKSPKYKVCGTTKSLAGSLGMLCITFIILSGFLAYFRIPYWYFKAVGISIILTILEGISPKGTDNLTVPLATVGMLLLVI